MTKKVKLSMFIALAILAFAGFTAGLSWIIRPKPLIIGMDTQVAVEAMSIVKRMYSLEGNISCIPGTTVDVLAEVMVDSPDFHATSYDKNLIEKVYGKQALAHAGLLTSKQALYLSRDLPAPTVSNPGTDPTLRPTARPTYLCSPDPESKLDELLHFVSVAQVQDGDLIVTYDYTSGRYEAIIRVIDGKWKITSVKMIKFYGYG